MWHCLISFNIFSMNFFFSQTKIIMELLKGRIFKFYSQNALFLCFHFTLFCVTLFQDKTRQPAGDNRRVLAPVYFVVLSSASIISALEINKGLSLHFFNVISYVDLAFSISPFCSEILPAQ